MKKVIIAFDGCNYSEGAFDFARQMNQQAPILLTGVFLPQLEYANLWSYAYSAASPVFVPLTDGDDAENIRKNISRFEKECLAAKIEYTIHTEFWDFALPELRIETRYADLMILGSEKFYANLGKTDVNSYLQDSLHDAECPIVVVPEKFTYPQNAILTYDGTASSLFAIKQFAYLFSDFADRPVTLIHINESAVSKVPDHNRVEELLQRHFTDLTILDLEMDAKKYFATWISEKPGTILICGSFGRSGVSNLLKRSFVNDVISDHNLPVFIAHR
ncbi:MAG: hypothetical protein EOO04_26410 [Chitinophagaceae bacterium]|nr:MAG: hypothetical protein EOO04_26410 [Chitinophagaceae bacterium]